MKQALRNSSAIPKLMPWRGASSTSYLERRKYALRNCDAIHAYWGRAFGNCITAISMKRLRVWSSWQTREREAMSQVKPWVLACVALVCLTAPSVAQVSSGSLRGDVRDEESASVAGVI